MKNSLLALEIFIGVETKNLCCFSLKTELLTWLYKDTPKKVSEQVVDSCNINLINSAVLNELNLHQSFSIQMQISCSRCFKMLRRKIIEFLGFLWYSGPVLRLHGILSMAKAIPTNPPVAMYGQYAATGGKGYSEFHQWPSVEIDNFRSDNLVSGTFSCQKMEKKFHAI